MKRRFIGVVAMAAAGTLALGACSGGGRTEATDAGTDGGTAAAKPAACLLYTSDAADE